MCTGVHIKTKCHLKCTSSLVYSAGLTLPLQAQSHCVSCNFKGYVEAYL